MKPVRHRGVTLVEVLVVVTILGLLVAILLPAVQSVREASRRATCLNHLAEFGRAVHSFEAQTNHFPEGIFSSTYSIHVQLLPFLEQKPLYDSINFSIMMNMGDPSSLNATVAGVRLALFLCPADRAESSTSFTASTNYAGNRGVGVQRYGYNGVFPMTGSLNSREISDGTSQTALMSEWTLGPKSDTIRDARRTIFETAVSLTESSEFDKFVQLCHATDPNRSEPSIRIKGFGWIIGEFGNSLYNHSLGINDFSCLNKTAVQVGAFTAGSFHRGGVNTLFADGHVSFVRDTIDLRVWHALGSRNGGEIVDAGAY